jgi:hypothetical protein
VTVSGKSINIEVNSNSLFPTTLQEFINAINSANSPASNLVEAKLISGTGTTKIGRLPLTYSPITLRGVNETEIVPGYVGFGDSDREVVLRFAESLQQSQYRIDILGQGLRALKNVNGQAFNDGVSIRVEYSRTSRIDCASASDSIGRRFGATTQPNRYLLQRGCTDRSE